MTLHRLGNRSPLIQRPEIGREAPMGLGAVRRRTLRSLTSEEDKDDIPVLLPPPVTLAGKC